VYVSEFCRRREDGPKEAYLEHCASAAEIFKSHGALRSLSCGERMCPRARRHPIRWPLPPNRMKRSSRAGRNGRTSRPVRRMSKKAMSDPRFQEMGDLPFDGKKNDLRRV